MVALRQVCCDGGVAMVVLRQVCCDGGVATVVLRQVCYHCGVATVVLQRWRCNNPRSLHSARRWTLSRPATVSVVLWLRGVLQMHPVMQGNPYLGPLSVTLRLCPCVRRNTRRLATARNAWKSATTCFQKTTGEKSELLSCPSLCRAA
eukprot:355798-Chlamydomonas_euryale.AAC.4